MQNVIAAILGFIFGIGIIFAGEAMTGKKQKKNNKKG